MKSTQQNFLIVFLTYRQNEKRSVRKVKSEYFPYDRSSCSTRAFLHSHFELIGKFEKRYSGFLYMRSNTPLRGPIRLWTELELANQIARLYLHWLYNKKRYCSYTSTRPTGLPVLSITSECLQIMKNIFKESSNGEVASTFCRMVGAISLQRILRNFPNLFRNL